MKPFKITLDFDGQVLTVDYHDGSDKEHYAMLTEETVKTVSAAAVATALSEEAD